MQGTPKSDTYSMNFNLVKQSGIAAMMNKAAENIKFSSYQAQPHEQIRMPATIKTADEFMLYLAKNRILGGDSYVIAILAASREPKLAIYLPDGGVEAKSLELAEQKRDQSGFVQQVSPQTSSGNKSELKNKKYSANPYSYRKSFYSADYFKSAAKAIYRGIDKKVREAFGKIRSVYQSSSGVFRDKKIYDSKDAAKGSVASLESYRTARNQRQYSLQHSDSDLEERVA